MICYYDSQEPTAFPSLFAGEAPTFSLQDGPSSVLLLLTQPWHARYAWNVRCFTDRKGTHEH